MRSCSERRRSRSTRRSQPRRPAREDVAGHVQGRRRPRAGRVRRVVRALPALVGRVRASSGCCRSSPRSDSTSSTCRRCTRSGARTGRERTTRWSRRRASRQPVGDRRRRGRSRGGQPGARNGRGVRADGRPRPRGRLRGLHRLRDPVSPDHPWLKQHPEWFYRWPDGTLKYAENPPKRYQDIYNVNFGPRIARCGTRSATSCACGSTAACACSASTTRTKPVAFWEWLIAEIRATDPDVIFLSRRSPRRR